MNRPATRLLSFLIPLVAAAATTSAQTLSSDHAHDGVRCGTTAMMETRDARLETFRREHPERYRRLMAEAKAPRESRINAAFDIEDYFYVDAPAGSPEPYVLLPFVLAYEGPTTRLWIDVRDTTRLSKANIARVIRGLDTATDPRSRNPNQGIVQNNIDLFGVPPRVVSQDEKTDFLLTDLPNPGVLGYFSPGDQMRATENPFSNQRNVLYVDDRQGFSNMEVLLSTLAHEHQHLIHNGRNATSRTTSRGDLTIFNEGLAELASILNGYYDRTITAYMANTNVDMFRYTRDNLNLQNADYERATNFLTYLHEQFGEKFIYDLVGLGDVGMIRLNSALDLSGYRLFEFDWRTVMRNYTVANYVKVPPAVGSQFGIRHMKFQTAKVNPTGSYNGTDYPRSGTLNVERHGSLYHVYNNPGVISYRYTHPASRPVAVMAMYFKGNELVFVDALEANKDYQLGIFGGPYTRIVLGAVGLTQESGTTAYSWTAEPLATGVEEDAVATAVLAIAPVYPNPVREEARIDFTLARGSGAIHLDLYDMQGRHMSTLFEGTGAAGTMSARLDVSNLVEGVYMLRLRQGDRMVTTPVIVSK